MTAIDQPKLEIPDARMLLAMLAEDEDVPENYRDWAKRLLDANEAYRRRMPGAPVDWASVMHASDNVARAICLRLDAKELPWTVTLDQPKLDRVVGLVQTVARDFYARGMLHVQNAIIGALDLRHLLR